MRTKNNADSKSTSKKENNTIHASAIQSYNEMKKRHPDAILLFRVRDFYEAFFDDAKATADILGIILSRCDNGNEGKVELAMFPHSELDTCLPKLVRAGRRVAICEQLEDSRQTKKPVKRGINN